MKKIMIILIISVVLNFFSCNKLKKTLVGGWGIDNMVYRGKNLMNQLSNNSIYLNKDNTCDIPVLISSLNGRATVGKTGIWTCYEKDKSSYLKIISSNKLFNRIFKVTNFGQELDYKNEGYLFTMSLVADSIKIDCAKNPLQAR